MKNKKFISATLVVCTILGIIASLFVVPASATSSSTISTGVNGVYISTSSLTVTDNSSNITVTVNANSTIQKSIKSIKLTANNKTYALTPNKKATVKLPSSIGKYTISVRIDFNIPVLVSQPPKKATSQRFVSTSFCAYVVKDVDKVVANMKKLYKQGSTYPYLKNAGCHHFACEFMQNSFNSAKPTPSNKNYQYIYATASSGKSSQIRPLDMVRYRNGNYDHTIVILKIQNGTVYYADCNSDLKNTVKYNQTMKLTTLEKYLKNTLLDQSISTRGYIAHFKNNYL